MDTLSAGIDVGSVTTKAVIADGDGTVLGKAILPTGISGEEAAREALGRAMQAASLPDSAISYTIATGYGRNLVSFADKQLTEITCHARGAFEHLKSSLTLIDIGGQDCKAMAIDTRGKVERFIMNDRCAAGTGRFLEVMARVLETDVAHMSRLALESKRPVVINNMCTVFAESEVVSLLARQTPREEIAAGLIRGIGERVGAMLRKISRADKDVYISGGVALNAAIVVALGDYLGCEVQVLPEPQFTGAYGAALLASKKKDEK